jgi:hypothetical protein
VDHHIDRSEVIGVHEEECLELAFEESADEVIGVHDEERLEVVLKEITDEVILITLCDTFLAPKIPKLIKTSEGIGSRKRSWEEKLGGEGETKITKEVCTFSAVISFHVFDLNC